MSVELSKEILNTIAENLESGEKCFIHKLTGELVSYPDDDSFDFEEDINPWQDDKDKVEADSAFVEFEKMPSKISFQVMEDYANSVNNREVKIRLLTALDGKKPFANFKHQIDNLGEWRELWFDFRRKKNIEWVREQLSNI